MGSGAFMTNPFDVEAGDANPFGRGGSPSAAPGRGTSRPTPPTPQSPAASPPGGTATGVGSDLTEDLERLQRQALAVRDMLDSAEAESPVPAQTAGTDRSGAITVILGADGLPEALRVAPDWERMIRPEQFAPAIDEASNAARTGQMTSTAEALQRMRGRSPLSSAPGQVPPAAGRGSRQVEPRPLGALVEDALKLFTEVEQFRPPQPAQGTGHAAGGRLSVTLFAGGGVSCSADPQWVPGKPATMLADAFREAVWEARSALARAQPADASPVASPAVALKGVFDEVMALLQDPSRLTET